MSSRCHRIGTGPTHSPCKYLGFIFFTTFIMTDNPSIFIMTPLIPMMIMLTTALSPTSPFAESVKRTEEDFFALARTKLAMQLLQHSSKSSVSEKNKIKRWKDKKSIFSQAWDSEVPAIFKVCCQPDASGPCNHVTSDYCDDLDVWHGSGDCNVITIIQYVEATWQGWLKRLKEAKRFSRSWLKSI